MNSRKLFHLTVMVGLVLLSLLANLVGLAEATPVAAAEAANSLNAAKPAANSPSPSSSPSMFATDSAESALPAAEPPHRPQLQAAPVLTLTKTADPDPVSAGSLLTYTLVVENGSITPATGVIITDTLDTRVTFASASDGGSPGAGVVSWGGIEVAADGGTITRTLWVTVNQVASGTMLSNLAELTSDQGSTASDSIATTVNTSADLSISKTNEQGQTVPGRSVTYTIVVSNIGPSNVTGATVTDTMPTALTGVNWDCTGSGGATCTASGSGNIDDTVNIPAGGILTYTVTGVVSPGVTGLLINTASVIAPSGVLDPDSTNNDATDTDTLTPRADLSISKSNGQNEVVPGRSVTYTIVVSNPGPSNVTGATVSDNFPTELASINWNCTSSGGATCTASGSTDINDTVDLPVGSSLIYTVTATIDPWATGQLANTASVGVPLQVTDPDSDNNESTDTDNLTPTADLEISKDNGQNQTVPGEETTYTIVVTNTGPSAVTGATITDNFPSMTGVTWTCTGSGGATCPNGSGSGNLNEMVNLPVGGSLTYEATGTVDPWVTGQLANTASVAVPGGVTDPDLGDNDATDTDDLTPRADLSISKNNGQTQTVPGENTTYTIIVGNAGPSAVTGATITDNFPSMTGVTWTCTGSGGATCPNGSGSGNLNEMVNLPVNGSLTYVATGTVDPGARGSLANTASVAVPGGVTDPVSGNNSASDTDTLTPQANLQIAKSASPNPIVFAGNILTYNLIVTNTGPSNATGVMMVDNLPTAGISFVSANPSQGSCSGTGTITCNLGEILSGSDATVSIQVRVNPSWEETLTNQASVNGTEPDPNPLNNYAPPVYTSVERRTDLAITKSDSSDPTLLGNPLTYTLTIANYGPSNATNVEMTDTLPTNVNLVSATASLGGICSGTSTVTCDWSSMNSGDTAVVTIVVDPQQTGSLSNSASVTGFQTDPDTGNNSDSETTTVNAEADLAVSMTATPNPVLPGEDLTYNITVTNNGPSEAINVSLTDSLPGGVTYVSATPSQGSCSGTSTINCSLDNLARDGNATVEIVVKVNESTAGNLANTVTVSSNITDPVGNNDSKTITILVGQYQKVFLPIVIIPQPTELFVHNDNTGGNVTFVVRNLSTLAEVTRCTVGNTQTIPCDHDSDGSNIFPPGTYEVFVDTHGSCGSNTFNKTYNSGPQTTRVFCN